MEQGDLEPAELREAPEPADGRVARVRPRLAQVVAHLVAVVRPERQPRVVRRAARAPALLLEQRVDDGRDGHVAVEVVRFDEGRHGVAIGVRDGVALLHVPQVDEVDPRRERARHRRDVVARAWAGQG